MRFTRRSTSVPPSRALPLLLVAATVFALPACDQLTGTTDEPNVHSVQVTPEDHTFTALNQTLQLTAAALNETGGLVSATLTWSSSDETVATVSGSGLVTAVGNGTATISATAGGASGAASIEVAQEITTLTVSPAAAALAALADTVTLEATAEDANGFAIDGDLAVTWSSSNEAVATVDDGGKVTAVSNGSTTITASTADASDGATIVVSQEVAMVEVAPGEATMTALADTATLSATAQDANGFDVVGSTLTWSSSDTTVATVGAEGLVTAKGAGTATISASTGSISGGADITVAQEAQTLSVTPALKTLTALNATAMITAAAADANGFAIASLSVTWASSNDAVATVSAAGVVTAVGNGTATITATSGGLSDEMTVTVEQAVAEVTVTPTDATLHAVGSTVQLTGTAGDANGHPVPDSAVAWTSSDTTVATVAGTGLVTAIEQGTATITGSAGGFEGTATITVVLPVASVTVSPGADTISVGGSATLTATVADSGGTALADRVVAWSSADPAIAMVDSTGTVTGVAVGTATITAASGGASGDAAVVVESAPVASVEITGQNAHALYITNASGYPDSLQLTATPKDANDNPLSRSVTWMSLDTTRAKVSGTGLVTDGAYLAGDSVGIVATSEGQADTAYVAARLIPVASIELSADTIRLARNDTVQVTVTMTDTAGTVLDADLYDVLYESTDGSRVDWVTTGGGPAVVGLNGASPDAVDLTVTADSASATVAVHVVTALGYVVLNYGGSVQSAFNGAGAAATVVKDSTGYFTVTFERLGLGGEVGESFTVHVSTVADGFGNYEVCSLYDADFNAPATFRVRCMYARRDFSGATTGAPAAIPGGFALALIGDNVLAGAGAAGQADGAFSYYDNSGNDLNPPTADLDWNSLNDSNAGGRAEPAEITADVALGVRHGYGGVEMAGEARRLVFATPGASVADSLATCQTQYEAPWYVVVVCSEGDYEQTADGAGEYRQMKQYVIAAQAGRVESGANGIYYAAVAFDGTDGSIKAKTDSESGLDAANVTVTKTGTGKFTVTFPDIDWDPADPPMVMLSHGTSTTYAYRGCSWTPSSVSTFVTLYVRCGAGSDNEAFGVNNQVYADLPAGGEIKVMVFN